MKLRLHPILLAGLLAACGSDSAPPLSASGITVVSPVPGRSTTVAYMTLHNGSREAVVLQQVTSPSFDAIELHESTNTDGVSRMRQLDTLTIAANSSAQLGVGGKHLMLIGPGEALTPGNNVTLHLHYDNGGVLILSAPVQTRYPSAATE